MKPHVVTYRNAGHATVLEVPASKDPFELLDRVQRKLFPGMTDEQRKTSARRADEILRLGRDRAAA